VVVLSVTFVYAGLGRSSQRETGTKPQQSRLVASRRVVRELAAVFALDSAGGGFVGNALIAAWLMKRFHFALGQTGMVLALAAAASALSSLLAPRLSKRFGLVETMVFTHAPANVLCILVGFAPSATVAVGLLVVRALLSQLDVPPRQTFVMTLVPANERSAAAAFTNLPRSLAAAATPPIAGWLLYRSNFGWPLILGGSMKLAYDGLLLVRFRRHSTKV
jgi:MFS family permease